ncbi:glycosyltransferase family 4 protein [Marinagarivorans algicola]|uniref:glycosyltransferase family 4 protein n=1 Tax=Marinagarivorans algicola TaxID=1513270 RepID=UPI0006B4D903|nr:glycosyltransferase family 4 protein [Marinagarivorans algicola]
MHIDLLLDSRGFGGIEAHVFELSKALLNCGHTPVVIFIDDYGEHPLKDKLHQEAITVLHINLPWLKAINWLRKRRPDVLHTHGYKAGIIGRLAGRLGHFGVCSSYHSGESTRGRLAIYAWLDRLTAPLAHEIIAVSHKIARNLPQKTHVLNNFVEPKATLSRGTKIAFVGRLSHEKAADRLLKAAQALPSTQFDIYGDGPLFKHYKMQASANVVFHGAQPMEQHWPNIGLLLMPSRYEGLPLAALEAMSHGIPAIATPAGDIPALIQHNHNGWLLKASTSKDNNAEQEIIADIIKMLMHWKRLNAAQHRKIQQSAHRTIAKRYSTHSTLPKFLDCYMNTATGIYRV